MGESLAKEQKVVSEAHQGRVKGVWDKMEQIKADRAAREAETVEKPPVTGEKTKQLVEAWRLNQALRDGKSPAELGLSLPPRGETADLRSRLDAMREKKSSVEPERNRRADDILRELVDGLERVGKKRRWPQGTNEDCSEKLAGWYYFSDQGLPKLNTIG